MPRQLPLEINFSVGSTMRAYFEVDTDVLKMARSKEKREAIKWFYARRVFFELQHFDAGLDLARGSEHPDARFLSSLFPQGAPVTREEVRDFFLERGSQRDDGRCLCWGAMLSDDASRMWMVQKAAENGVPLAQALGFLYRTFKPVSNEEKKAIFEGAALQGEPKAMRLLAVLCDREVYPGKERARQMWLAAAELGDADSQFEYALNCCEEFALRRMQWLRRSARQKFSHASKALLVNVLDQISLYDSGGSGRLLYEIGAADLLSPIRCQDMTQPQRAAVERATELYRRCHVDAKRAVMCWLWLAVPKGVVRDIRVLIADLIWDCRADWMDSPAFRKVRV